MKDVFTTGDVAKICNVTIRTVIKWFESGELEGYKIPGSKDRRIPRDNLINFMKRHNIPLRSLSPNGTGKRKILIADDDKGIVSFLEAYFQKKDIFEIKMAYNGYEAGLLTMEFHPEVLLLDYNLGDTDGAQVTRIIRNNPAISDTKILVMSGFLPDDEVETIFEAGVDDYIKKPFRIEDLMDKVYRLLGIIT